MNSKKIGKEIAKARKSQNIKLNDLAADLLISKAYIKQIEAGEFDFLPEPYVLAYTKLIANKVGLDADALLQEYGHTERAESGSSASTTTAKSTTGTEEDSEIQHFLTRDMSPGAIAGASATIILAVMTIWYFSVSSDEGQLESHMTKAVIEAPISTIIKENQVKTDSLDTARELKVEQPAEKLKPFTLTLNASDTVWMSINIDDASKKEYIFPPGMSRTWHAETFFQVLTGNAGATELLRDGKAIGSIGKARQVRTVKVMRDSLILK